MTIPTPWSPGDPLSASRLNLMVTESVKARTQVSYGNGSSLVNETLGNQSANMRRPMIKLVTATENFEIQPSSTDLVTVTDDVPSGMVKEVRLNRGTGIHAPDFYSAPFRAWDVMSGLTDAFCDSASNSDSTDPVANEIVECDVFYVIYNEDSKRWEVLSFAGSSLNIIHGIVHHVIGKGYYEIEVSEWSGSTPACDLRSGSDVYVPGQGYESGSDIGEACGICDILSQGEQVGSSFQDCEDTLTVPDPDNHTSGTSVIVLAYDPQSVHVPLKEGTDCLMVYIGDRNVENSLSASGSESSSENAPRERVYQIVRGYQEHIVEYKDEYECCPTTGAWTLIKRTAVIFAGVSCPVQICAECEEE